MNIQQKLSSMSFFSTFWGIEGDIFLMHILRALHSLIYWVKRLGWNHSKAGKRVVRKSNKVEDTKSVQPFGMCRTGEKISP